VATRARDGDALQLDAYFPDEVGLAYLTGPKQGASLNRFTRLFVKSGLTVTEITHAEAAARNLDPADPRQFDHLQPGTISMPLSNPLDASVNPSVKLPEANIPPSARGHVSTYTGFVPPRLRAEVADILSQGRQCPRSVRVALFFGTGSELGRHGLRAFVDRSSWRIIVNVPGVEPEWAFAEGLRWGIGISKDQVGRIVAKCFGQSVPFVIDRLAGFSTGYVGVTGTIRNELIDLRDVEVLALFDCNYGELRVKDSIRSLRSATSHRVRVIAYASSLAGTPDAARRKISLDIDTGGAAWLFGRPDFQILTHARVLGAGLGDKTVDWAEIAPSLRPALAALFAALPARGSVVTDPSIHQLVYGRGPATGSVTLEGWYKANKTNADLFFKALWHRTATSPELVRLIWKHKLPGWDGKVDEKDVDTIPVEAFAEGVHDFVPFEFAWEILS
jgi:hypothetical protein